MTEKLKANTQYDDLIGDAALDGHSGGPLHELADKCGMPHTHFPVGMSVYFGNNGFFNLSICGCEKSEYGTTIEELKRHHTITGKRFEVEIGKDEFLEMVKRFHITLRPKELIRTDIEVED